MIVMVLSVYVCNYATWVWFWVEFETISLILDAHINGFVCM